MRPDVRAASSCGNEGLNHMEVLEAELRDDSNGLMKASCEQGRTKGCPRKDRGRHGMG